MKRVLAALMVTGALLTARVAPTDLEIGLTAGATQFMSYEDLLRLPQVSFAASNDSNFSTPSSLSGVPLDQLKRSLGAHQDMVVAICEDGC